jgi:hypothetical protein
MAAGALNGDGESARPLFLGIAQASFVPPNWPAEPFGALHFMKLNLAAANDA